MHNTRRKTRNFQVEIVLFDRIDTPFGPVFVDRDRMGLSLVMGLIGAVAGMGGGTLLASQVTHPLSAPLIGMCCGLACAATLAFHFLKAA